MAARLVREFIDRKEECFVGRKFAVVQKVANFFPTFVRDAMMLSMDGSIFPPRSLDQVSDQFKKPK